MVTCIRCRRLGQARTGMIVDHPSYIRLATGHFDRVPTDFCPPNRDVTRCHLEMSPSWHSDSGRVPSRRRSAALDRRQFAQHLKPQAPPIAHQSSIIHFARERVRETPAQLPVRAVEPDPCHPTVRHDLTAYGRQNNHPPVF